jgi:hypothetical protein
MIRANPRTRRPEHFGIFNVVQMFARTARKESLGDTRSFDPPKR